MKEVEFRIICSECGTRVEMSYSRWKTAVPHKYVCPACKSPRKQIIKHSGLNDELLQQAKDAAKAILSDD